MKLSLEVSSLTDFLLYNYFLITMQLLRVWLPMEWYTNFHYY